MRYLARSADGTVLLGDDEGFVPLAAADSSLQTMGDALQRAPEGLPAPGDARAARIPAEDITFGLPLAPVKKLWGIGLNYADHAADLHEVRPEEPASFVKPPSTATGPGGPIRLPDPEITNRVTAEAELGVVMGRTFSHVDEDEFDDVVAGFVPIIDMTAEDVLEKNPRFLTRAKSFDTFLVAGPWIAVPDSPTELLDSVAVRTVVNDEVIAENTLEGMLFEPPELVSFHSQVMTFEPGDVISTGTPGAGVIEPGDSVRAEVDPVGVLESEVR
ncbi:fumarylacetoacetate hydrolase family protein [Haladaptatus sp. DYSN1]|uniref:fumarylacetoacetate hydrolase family protein n=1 Tax=unclassified Haladaptatus TaxID=2622732 RepID=UPI002405B6E5|nr:fumarylacetoacetate hydrolase family protein [Haladaptatus sp. DYSN1]